MSATDEEIAAVQAEMLRINDAAQVMAKVNNTLLELRDAMRATAWATEEDVEAIREHIAPRPGPSAGELQGRINAALIVLASTDNPREAAPLIAAASAVLRGGHP